MRSADMKFETLSYSYHCIKCGIDVSSPRNKEWIKCPYCRKERIFQNKEKIVSKSSLEENVRDRNFIRAFLPEMRNFGRDFVVSEYDPHYSESEGTVTGKLVIKVKRPGNCTDEITILKETRKWMS